MKKYLLSEADRKEIARALSKERSAPPPSLSTQKRTITHEEGDSFWVLPPCETGLPGAIKIGNEIATVGIQCCLFRHNWKENRLEQMLDAAGTPLRVTVFNYYDRSENGLVQVYKHKDGSWTNERPAVVITSSPPGSDTTTEPPLPPDPECVGVCSWQADGNGRWHLNSTCADATTTSTTTTTGGPTTNNPQPPLGTSHPDSPPTTIPPCIDSSCRLVCIDTSTTPAPNEYGVPVPYARFRYALAPDSPVCPEGCTCYGLGDPCFLIDGELNSKCIGIPQITTTSPPATPDPNAHPCVQAEFVFGTVTPGYARYVKRRDPTSEWEYCEQCEYPAVELYPLRGDKYRRHDWKNLPDVYDTPCVKTPCAEAELGRPVPQNHAVFRAYHYDQQVHLWGLGTGAAYKEENRFKANFFLCRDCPGANQRPESAPPIWLTDNANRNAVAGVRYDETSNTYFFTSRCVEGKACNVCVRAPERKLGEGDDDEPELDEVTTGVPTTSTTSAPPTTTIGPCGCEPPSYCPHPYECTKTACRKGVSPSAIPQPCVDTPSSPPPPTTPLPPTTNPPPPPPPGFCYDDYGTLCDCNPPSPPSTFPPSGGTCPPGCRLFDDPEDPCDTPYCYCPEEPGTTPPPPPPFVPCTGVCVYDSVRLSSSVVAWRFRFDTCEKFATLGCKCPWPPRDPNFCGDAITIGCESPPRPPTTSPPRPCSCCGTTGSPTTTGPTTLPPCPQGICRYTANSIGGWTLIQNTCRNQCTCAPASSIQFPSEPCQTFSLGCGQRPPTTRPPTTPPCTENSCEESQKGSCCFNNRISFWCVSGLCRCQCRSSGNFTASFRPGGNCGEDECQPPPPFGRCCLPNNTCLDTDQENCARFFGAVWQGGKQCGEIPGCPPPTTTPNVTTTPGPTTTASPTSTTSTTTNNPNASCCFLNGPFPICAADFGSNNCIAAGGSIVSDCSLCVLPTTAPPTTTDDPGTTAPPPE